MGFFDGVSNNVKLKLKQDQISKLSDAWYIEQSSINRDIRNRVLYCRIFRPDPPLYYVQYVALHFDRAKFGKYAILETAAYNIQTKKYSDYKKQRLEKSFSEDQTDAMGILYNLEAKRMGVSYLPLTEGEEHPFYQYVDSQKKQHELSYIINGDIIADAKRRIYNVFWVDRVKSFASVIHETHDYIRVQVQDEAFKFLDVEFATVEGGHRIRTSFYAGDDLPQDAFRKYFKAFSKDIQESVRLEKAGKESGVRPVK